MSRSVKKGPYVQEVLLKRINEMTELEDLIFNSPLLDNSILTMISDFTFQVMNGEPYIEIKKEVKKGFKKLSPSSKHLLEIPASRLRFTSYDQIKSNKKVTETNFLL